MLGLDEFKDQYFCGPLYQDVARSFYEHLGNQPIFTWSTLWKAVKNPFKTRAEMKKLGKRMEAKGVTGNLRGDGLITGGVLVISPSDEILHTFNEDPGQGIPESDAAKIVKAAQSLEREYALPIS